MPFTLIFPSGAFTGSINLPASAGTLIANKGKLAIAPTATANTMYYDTFDNSWYICHTDGNWEQMFTSAVGQADYNYPLADFSDPSNSQYFNFTLF